VTRNSVVSTLAVCLVAVACSPGASDSTAASTTSDVSTSLTTREISTATSTSLTSAPSTPASLQSTTTTTPGLECLGIGWIASLELPPGSGSVTFVSDGVLFVATLNAENSARCLAELPERLATQRFVWRPAGDQILFEDGTILGEEGVVRDQQEDSAAGAEAFWTRPTGTSTVEVRSEVITKVSVDGSTISTFTPLLSHESAAYHPDGTTFAVAGFDGNDQGVFIAANDGSDVRVLAFADIGLRFPEMAFTADARWLVFIADHNNDEFSHGFHLHSTSVEPFKMDDGTLAVGAGSEFGMTTHLESDDLVNMLSLAPGGSGAGDVPNGLAVARGECGPNRRALFLPDMNTSQDAVVLADRPSYPVGFIGIGFKGADNRLVADIVIATSEDGCTGPFEFSLVTLDLAEFTMIETTIAVGQNAAIQSTPPPVAFTLAGVTIDPFA